MGPSAIAAQDDLLDWDVDVKHVVNAYYGLSHCFCLRDCAGNPSNRYCHGILARCRHPLNTSVVEGINNTIKVIKRRAYRYHDEEYFFLKIRAEIPGNPR
ncbi:transposase family protein [Burkholderia cepacia]|nr:transposase family protein [Burkholderia cepacia]